MQFVNQTMWYQDLLLKVAIILGILYRSAAVLVIAAALGWHVGLNMTCACNIPMLLPWHRRPAPAGPDP
jgi:hypothetical protein